MPEPKSKRDRGGLPEQFLSFVKEEYDRKFDAARSDIASLRETFREDMERLRAEIRSDTLKEREDWRASVENLNDKIDAVEKQTVNKIDAIDTSLRGNGVVGYGEQIRQLKLWLIGVSLCVLGLLGFEVGGVTLKDWLASWKEETAIVSMDSAPPQNQAGNQSEVSNR